MGLGRKKSRYVSFGELAKASETERAKSAVADDFDAANRLSDIEARVFQARRHINNARVEAIAHQEASGESAAPIEPAVTIAAQNASAKPVEDIAPQSTPDPQIADVAPIITPIEPARHTEFPRRFIDDIDDSDVESIEKSFFEERPVSIEENMRQADEAHARRKKSALIFALIAVLLVVGIGLVVFGLTGASDQNGEPTESGAQGSSQDEALAPDSTSIARRYQTDEYGEAGVSVYEVMEFGEDGLCDRVTLKATFSNAAATKAFLVEMRESHGSNCMESYVNGTTGVAVIDVSDLEMTEEEYSASSEGEIAGLKTQEVPAALVSRPSSGSTPQALHR